MTELSDQQGPPPEYYDLEDAYKAKFGEYPPHWEMATLGWEEAGRRLAVAIEKGDPDLGLPKREAGEVY